MGDMQSIEVAKPEVGQAVTALISYNGEQLTINGIVAVEVITGGFDERGRWHSCEPWDSYLVVYDFWSGTGASKIIAWKPQPTAAALPASPASPVEMGNLNDTHGVEGAPK